MSRLFQVTPWLLYSIKIDVSYLKSGLFLMSHLFLLSDSFVYKNQYYTKKLTLVSSAPAGPLALPCKLTLHGTTDKPCQLTPFACFHNFIGSCNGLSKSTDIKNGR
jgi:hypothetical protein